MKLALNHLRERFQDFVFLALIAVCLLFALGGVCSELATRETQLAVSTGRKVDVSKVRKQITDGTLSSRKARFYKRFVE